MNNINSRYLAYKILYDIEKKNEYSDETIEKYFSKFEIDSRDKNLVRRIVYGYLENKYLLDFYIKNISNKKIDKIDLEILIILRIGIYQIVFLDKIPNSAAVNESVKVAKKVNYRTTGFVNGILRNFIRKMDTINFNELNEVERLEIKYSHPKWLINYFKENIKDYNIEDVLKFNNSINNIYVRTNTLKISRENLIEKLKKLGINCEKSELTKSGIKILVLNDVQLMDNELFNKGYYYIQDDASILVAEVLAPNEKDLVIDTCASPGGKTTHMAQLMNNKGVIIARDVSKYKINLIKQNIDRLGINNIKTEIFDATKDDYENEKKVDKVLVDAPCSGLGIISKNPEIKYNKKMKDIDNLSKIQSEILQKSSKLVKPGGYLVYSTCTIGPKENIEVIENFLYNNKDFKRVKIDGKDYLEILPGKYKTDGFFICKLKRILR